MLTQREQVGIEQSSGGEGQLSLLWSTAADTILMALAVLQVLSPTPSSLKDRRKW